MKSRLLLSVIPVLLAIILWQHRSLTRLRHEAAERDGTASATTAVEVARLQAELAQQRAAAATAPPDVAALHEQIAALQQANADFARQTVGARETGDIFTGSTGSALTTIGAISAEPAAAEPETTGRYPNGATATWSHRQATGAPDTPEAGDQQTAWASRTPDGGPEWLQLRYPTEVEIAQVNIHETYNPGAVAKVTAVMPDGSERSLWEGTEPREAAPVEIGLPVPPGIRSDQIKIYVDTARVPGWNEIDAVELVGSDGSKQWASDSSASSYYGDQRGGAARLTVFTDSEFQSSLNLTQGRAQ